MALDFAVITEDEASADVVSLGFYQHDMLMFLAEQLQLRQLLRFEDYCGEVDLDPAELPALSEDLSIVKKSASTQDIQVFARNLDALITLAIKRNRPLSTMPD